MRGACFGCIAVAMGQCGSVAMQEEQGHNVEMSPTTKTTNDDDVHDHDEDDEEGTFPRAQDLMALAVPLFTTDAMGVILHANEAAMNFVGYYDEDLIGRQFTDFCAADKSVCTMSGSFVSTPGVSPRRSPRTSASTGSGTPLVTPKSSFRSPHSLRTRSQRALAGVSNAMWKLLPGRSSQTPWVVARARTRGGIMTPTLIAATATGNDTGLTGFTIIVQDLRTTQTARAESVAADRALQARDDRSRFVA